MNQKTASALQILHLPGLEIRTLQSSSADGCCYLMWFPTNHSLNSQLHLIPINVFLLTSSLKLFFSTTFGSFTHQIIANCKKWRIDDVGGQFAVDFWNHGEYMMICLKTEIELASNLLSTFELPLSDKLSCWARNTQIRRKVEKIISVNRQHSDFRNLKKGTVWPPICKELEYWSENKYLQRSVQTLVLSA